MRHTKRERERERREMGGLYKIQKRICNFDKDHILLDLQSLEQLALSEYLLSVERNERT